MKKETYNGWTNYATWRVNLEHFDGVNFVRDDVWGDTIADFADQLKGDVETRIDESATGEPHENSPRDSLAHQYAHAFISDVNWYEIAALHNEAYELGLS